jgi:hypothetical protein
VVVSPEPLPKAAPTPSAESIAPLPAVSVPVATETPGAPSGWVGGGSVAPGRGVGAGGAGFAQSGHHVTTGAAGPSVPPSSAPRNPLDMPLK